jgi:hypothetical protein
MALEVLDPKNSFIHKDGMSTTEEKMLRGGLLDMWHLYQHLSPTPDKLSDLTFFDTLSARDDMLFPDFFKAVHRFFVPSRFNISRVSQRPHPEGSDGLKTELNETFSTMNSNWESYGPFFNRHPELRYLRELSFRAAEVREFGEKLPFLRGIEANHLWSIVEYHRLRGNLTSYVALDTAISKNEGIGTLFEEDTAAYPGDFMIYLMPYGKAASRIAEYLPLLKHGDLIGFGSVSLAEANGQRFVAVTSLQTDLLRKDHAADAAPETRFAHYEMKKNSDGTYTVPGGISKRYLSGYDWAHRLVSTVENAVLEISGQIPIAGVIMPTLSTYGTSEFERLSRSQYASGLYESFPGEHGYQQLKLSPNFPLTEQWEKGAIYGSGTWWVKPTNQLKLKKAE